MAEAQTHQASLARTAAGLAREVRPWQWYKQAVLLIAIVFSGRLFDPVAWGAVAIGVAAFCAVAGATYVFNDISDVEFRFPEDDDE